MQVVPYLIFQGNAEEAMKFYEEAFNAREVTIDRYDSMPPSKDMPPIPDTYKDKILHGSMKIDDELFYFSDAFPDAEIDTGSNLEINLNIEDEDQLRSIFEKLSKGGEITMPLDITFWGSLFGSITDQYGFRWMLGMQVS